MYIISGNIIYNIFTLQIHSQNFLETINNYNPCVNEIIWFFACNDISVIILEGIEAFVDLKNIFTHIKIRAKETLKFFHLLMNQVKLYLAQSTDTG